MKALHIVTPVKDSIESTRETIRAIMQSKLSIPFTYTVYNDFSTPENSALLEEYQREFGFELIHLKDLTDHPSPNYLLVLQRCRHLALEAEAGLLLVESDVVVEPDTLQRLYDGALEREDCAIAASVTVDDQGEINYPYEYAKGHENQTYATKRHCSFCCSLLKPEFMQRCDFDKLDSTKHWFDVQISHDALDLGFKNYLFCNLPVIYRPHGSRPWKLLKKQNPLKYYWLKLTKGLDKI
jgi:hypothetical protein